MAMVVLTAQRTQWVIQMVAFLEGLVLAGESQQFHNDIALFEA
jgi:hypothetical protein